jgi:hypothetical protein
MKSPIPLLLPLLLVPIASASEYPVTFQTVTCEGESGFMAVDVTRVYRVQTVDCADGRKLRQVLIRNDGGSYDVATVDEAEALMLQQEVDNHARARREALRNSSSIIIQN